MEEEQIIGFDALYESMSKCARGVTWKDSVAHFVLQGAEETLRLEQSLHDGTYTPRPPKEFKITHPKPRDIVSVSFRDRVYQRSLNDNALYPIMTRSFIYDNWACQQDKGPDRARNRLKEFLRDYYRKHGTIGYVLQLDIRGYYPNMSHRATEEMFQRKLNHATFVRVRDVLHSQYPGEKGYNPGSQMIQIAGISMLDSFDHYAKERLHLHYYIRYMDDIIAIHHDRAYLEECLTSMQAELAKIEFEAHPTKTRIYKLSEGIPFIGFRFSLTNTGKALMLILEENVNAERRKLVRLVHKSFRGELPKESVYKSYASWRNHASKGDNWEAVQAMDGFYRKLWLNADTQDKRPCPVQGDGEPPGEERGTGNRADNAVRATARQRGN